MIYPLHYFPCVNGFAELLNEEFLQFDGDLIFKRSSFRNRMIVAGATGPISLSIPIVGGRNVKVPYKEVKIDNNNNWQRDHFRTLCTAYGNSPFFQFYKYELEDLYNSRPFLLLNWNLSCLQWVFKKVKIYREIVEPSSEKESFKTVNMAFEYTAQNYFQIPAQKIVKYNQVFEDKIGFLPNLSVLDLLFNTGPLCNQLFLNGATKLKSN